MSAKHLKTKLSSKRLEIALRFFTYGVMAISTVVLTAVAIFYAMGYRFNQSTLTIEQGGLIQFRSTPEGASITIDGKRSSAKTAGRAYVSAGTHEIEMQLSGYQTWRRTVSLQPGQLLWLDYIRFVPDAVTTSPLHNFAGVTDAAFSPDKHWLLVHEAANVPSFTLLDVSDEAKATASTMTIPDTQLTHVNGQLGTFTLLEWDFGSHAVLVRHDNGDVHEMLRIERSRPNEAVNISRQFSLNISDVHFAGGNQNIVYAQSGDVLRRLDIGAGTASAALVTGLTSFVIYGEDHIAFAADRALNGNDPASRKAVVGIYQNGKETLVRTYPTGTALRVALTEYFRHQYLAVAAGDAAVELLQDPVNKALETPILARVTLERPAAWLAFSGNGRMLAVGNGSNWATYDLEVAQAYTNRIASAEPTAPLRWLDDFYLWTDAGDKLLMVEFDGQNPREITAVTAGYRVGLSQNGKSLFSISKTTGGAVLQRSQLVK